MDEGGIGGNRKGRKRAGRDVIDMQGSSLSLGPVTPFDPSEANTGRYQGREGRAGQSRVQQVWAGQGKVKQGRPPLT